MTESQDKPLDCRFCGVKLNAPYKVCPSCSANQSIIGSLLKWGAIAGSLGSIIYLISWVFSIIHVPEKKPFIKITHSNKGAIFKVENTGKRKDELISAKLNISLKQKSNRQQHPVINSFYEYSFPTKIKKIIDPETFTEIKVIPSQSSQNLLISIDPKNIENIENIENIDSFCTNIPSLKLASELNQKNSCSVNFIFKNSINNNSKPFLCEDPLIQSFGQRMQASHHYCLQIRQLKEIQTQQTNLEHQKAYNQQIEQLERIIKNTIGIK